VSESSVARKPEERRRQLLYVAGGLALVVAVAALALLILGHKKPPDLGPPAPEFFDEQLRDAVADLDRRDPRWRFAALEADRAKVPDDENAAPLVVASAKLIPDAVRRLPTALLRDRLRKGDIDDKPRAEIEEAGAALFEARKLAGFRRGRHAVKWDFNNPLTTPLPHLARSRELVDLLTLDAEVRAHEGDVDGALVSVRAALVTARAVGDEPMLLSQSERLVWDFVSVQALEESLRRGEASEEKLRAVQSALEGEAAEPVLRTEARADRAGLHALMTALEKGEPNAARLEALPARAEGAALATTSSRSALEAIHLWLLDYTTKFVEITELPPGEQKPRLKALAATAPQSPAGTMPLLAPLFILDLSEACHKGQALLRCAEAAMAAERYRLANKGRWPDKLADLVPKYLSAVPFDPFDGRPLRYARHNDVVVMYSVGPDGKDDGGKPDELNKTSGSYDVGFRLWDVAARRKAK
jgi:hypothetical protein